ncbi:acyl-CoA desaturase [Actinomadura algeriensis]|uniref:Stearoyl-CoA desaturase (Delta-9 desaturase) n=1 Tax=Actinomadura algeriensis TaxID=1679523 RepID=A0ABR9JUX3_9ACTN|nr:acyl-CoA desaturase [Actinomadura algeriensis]MBE1534283.1 stearoyl-CoA desaturase (delta-9 desaturase) [Actinomadura algeriensis]
MTVDAVPARGGAVPDTDAQARRLAYLTVCVPAAGFAAALAWAFTYGFTLVDGLLLGGMYLVTALGVEGGLHRFFSHRAFSARPAVTAAWGVAGSMAAQGPIVFWVATHRIHHAFTDTDRDPHSPRPIGDGRFARLRGLWHGHAGWLFTVRRGNWSKHVPDLLGDRTVMRINELYFAWVLLGLAIPTVLGGLLTWSAGGAVGGLLWGGLARIFLLDQVTWGVNSIGHTLGRRPYRTRDNSRNVAVLAPLSVGGSWHNNHHARPSLAHNRHAFWQLDVTGAVIGLLEALRLVSDVRRPRPGGRDNPRS